MYLGAKLSFYLPLLLLHFVTYMYLSSWQVQCSQISPAKPALNVTTNLSVTVHRQNLAVRHMVAKWSDHMVPKPQIEQSDSTPETILNVIGLKNLAKMNRHLECQSSAVLLLLSQAKFIQSLFTGMSSAALKTSIKANT